MIKQADIIAYRGNYSLVSMLIRKISKSNYSHVGISVGNGLVVESDGYVGKVAYRSLNDYQGTIDIYSCEQLTDEQRQRICDYAISKIGDKYSYFLTLWIGVKYLFHILLPYYDTQNSENCSELVNLVYLNATGLRLCADKWPTPDEVVHSEFLTKSGEY